MKYSIGTLKCFAKATRLFVPGFDMPAFQFEKAVWLIPVALDTWYAVSPVTSISPQSFWYIFSPPLQNTIANTFDM